MAARILVGHVLDRLRDLPDESVHCVVTSPPYYGLRDYGIEPQVWGGEAGCAHKWQTEAVPTEVGGGNWTQGTNGRGELQAGGVDLKREPVRAVSERGFCLGCGAWRGSLGLEPTLALYLDHMTAVFREVRRVMRKDATCWLNIGDSYSAQAGQRKETDKAGIKQQSNVASTGAPSRSEATLKPKDLMMVPARLAIRLCDDGWWVRSDIAWCKRAPMPESCVDRPTSAWEHVFLLTKSGSSTYWTHRDHEGTRTRPAPDYRWVDHDNDEAETDVEPPNWRAEPISKRPAKDYFSVGIPGEGEQRGRREGALSSTPTPHKQRWSRINLWQAHDYFYDAEAVKEASEQPDRVRADVIGGVSFVERQQHSEGGLFTGGGKRNQRNIWLLGPEPFPGAHFATFPTEIPRRAILAGTSERGVCPKCAAPWERVIVSTGQTNDRDRSGSVDWIEGVTQGGNESGIRSLSGATYKPQRGPSGEWRPTCGCDAGEPVSATVLDPFLGSGTTALVADRLGRDCIGIELNPEYAAMARRRIEADAPLFAEVAG